MKNLYSIIPPSGLQEQQYEAVASKHSVVINAGPGTGKTSLIVGRVNFLRENNVRPHKILAITYTRIAGDMLKKQLSYNGRFMGKTFHALGMQIITRHWVKDGLIEREEVIPIVDEDMQRQEVANIISSIGLTSQIEPDDACEYIKKKKKMGLRPQNLSNEDPRYLSVYREYEKATTGNGKIDFEEMILKALEILKDNDSWRRYWEKRFRHIICDELQHITKVQYELLRMLSKHAVFFGLGDSDQSMFFFNQATSDIMERAKISLANNNAMTLKYNFRTVQKLISYGCGIIQDMRLNSTISRRVHNSVYEGVCITRCASHLQEADRIADRVQKLINLGVPYSEIAILCRYWRDTSSVEKRLLSLNIPIRKHKQNKPFTEQEAGKYESHIRTSSLISEPVNQAYSPSFNAGTDTLDGNNQVTVATFHGVRNLEFDHVFMVGMEQIVTNNAEADVRLIERERRLLYVAVTRAGCSIDITHIANHDYSTDPKVLLRYVDLLPTPTNREPQ